MPNGLRPAPRLFTKLLNPVFAHLRKEGCFNVSYIDDSLLLGDTFDDCLINMEKTVDHIGFTVHCEKINFGSHPTHCFLGFCPGL